MTDITDNLQAIDTMKAEQENLRLDIMKYPGMSEATKNLIEREIDAIQVDINDIAEATMRKIAKHVRGTIW